MRIRMRYGAFLALAGAAAVAAAGVAVAAPDGNISSVQGSGFKPTTLPKNTYKGGALIVHTHGNYAHPGSVPEGGYTDRTQLYFDNDGKINTARVPKCDKANISGNITMATAMANCGTAKVGTGTALAIAGPATVHACVLIFNGKPTGSGQPTDLIFTRAAVGFPSISCANPAANTNGNTTVLLEGVVKKNPASLGADFQGGNMLDVQHIQAASALPLSDFKTNTQRGSYISSRCHDANKRLDIKAKFTYSDGQSDMVGSSQACKVG